MTAPTIHDVLTATQVGGAATFVWSHVVGAGADRKLVVGLSGEANAGSPSWSAVTYGGVALTKAAGTVVNEASANWVPVEIWYLDNPTVGTADIVATFAGQNTKSTGHSFTLHGAATGAPDATSIFDTVTDATSISLALTTTTAGCLIMSLLGTNNGDIKTPTETKISEVAVSADQSSAVSAFEQTTAGAKTMAWTVSVTFGRAAIVNVAFKSVGGGASDTVTLTDFANKRVFPRTGATTAPIAATYTEAVASSAVAAEYRVMRSGTQIAGWTALVGSPSVSAGAVTGAITLPAAGGGYNLECRILDAGGNVLATTAGTNTWGVGKIGATIGSSTPTYWHSPGDQSGQTADPLAFKWDTHLTTPIWETATGGGAVAFDNAVIAADPGIPVALIDAGISGTAFADWDSTSDTGFTRLATAVAATGGVLEFVILHIGSNDARFEGLVSLAVTESRLRFVIDIVRTVYGSTIPIFIIGSQKAPLEPDSSDQQWEWMRGAELNVGDDANTYLGCMSADLTIGPDNTHVIAAGTVVAGKRVGRTLIKNVLGQSVDWRGPKPLSVAFVSAGVFDVTFQIRSGTGLVSATGVVTGITGFRVRSSDLATTRTITGAEIISPTVVRLTVTGGVSGDKIDYLMTHEPVTTNCLYDNGSAP